MPSGTLCGLQLVSSATGFENKLSCFSPLTLPRVLLPSCTRSAHYQLVGRGHDPPAVPAILFGPLPAHNCEFLPRNISISFQAMRRSFPPFTHPWALGLIYFSADIASNNMNAFTSMETNIGAMGKFAHAIWVQ